MGVIEEMERKSCDWLGVPPALCRLYGPSSSHVAALPLLMSRWCRSPAVRYSEQCAGVLQGVAPDMLVLGIRLEQSR